MIEAVMAVLGLLSAGIFVAHTLEAFRAHWTDTPETSSARRRGKPMLEIIIGLFYRQSCRTSVSAIRLQKQYWAWGAPLRLLVARFADGIGLRKYAFIDRARLPDQTRPFQVRFRNKSYNFAHIRAPKPFKDAPAIDANIMPQPP
jgi:hypothetical protein